MSQPNTITVDGFVFQIDSEDYEKVSIYSWHVSAKAPGYPQRQFSYGYKDGKQQLKTVMLHRFIMNAPDGIEVDHKNSNPFDLKKTNLRFATHQQNMFNRSKQKNNKSGYIGVWWSKQKSKWIAVVKVSRKDYYAGSFDNLEDAARARDLLAIKLHGEFAKLNFEERTAIVTT